jgi:hypothetical protein
MRCAYAEQSYRFALHLTKNDLSVPDGVFPVPSAHAAATRALKHGRDMQANGDSLRSIAFVWMNEFGLDKYDAKTVQRILAREDTAA